MLIPAGNPSLWTGPTGTNTYLLREEPATLIDAGVGHPSHLEALANALGGRPLALVLVTHSHPDHVSGVPAVLEHWPSAQVRPASRAFADGERIEAGGRVLIALHTPGHAPDHFSFFDEAAGDLYCGDLARAGGTVVIPGSRGGDLRAYLASLQRIRELRPRRLLPGHGPVVEEPDRLIDEYLAHRAEREEQILGVLDRGTYRPDDMVEEVYGTLPSALAAAAAESILAHLKKLEDEGKVEAEGERWRVRRE
jgi:glyoxylase-like metal-dependent hydrolase (beta-lactamase superfamily II)